MRVNIAYCGICGSDIHEYESGPIFTPAAGLKNPVTGLELPVTMGHEFVGTVSEIGSAVTNVKVGQNVVVDPILHDRHYNQELCHACKSGVPNACKRCTVYGLSHSGGGLASESVVYASTCIPMPDTMSLKVGALVEPLTVSYHAIRISGIKPGQTALVLGAGPIGLGVLILLRVFGVEKVIVSEPAEARARHAERFGATKVVNPSMGNDVLKAAVEELTDGAGVDVAFMTASHQTILDSALGSTRAGGTVFNCAIHRGPFQLNINDLTFHEKKLLTGMRCTDEDWIGVINAIGAGKIPHVEEMITSVVPLSQSIEGAFLELINNTENHVKILIAPDEFLKAPDA